MLTAIILTTAIVIAVGAYACCKVSGRVSRIEEDESYKWAVKWNKQRELEKTWCDNNCNTCEENDNCMFSEVAK